MVYKTTPNAHISLALPEYGAPKEFEKFLLSIHHTQPQGSSLGVTNKQYKKNQIFFNIPLKTSGLMYAGLPR